MSHHEIALSRATFVKRWTERAIALEADEARLKSSMDHSVAKATTCKRILLFREILEDLCYPDVGVVDELQQGVDLTGRVPVTGMLPGKFTPALLSDEALALRSSLTRARDENSACSSGDAEIDLGVWSQTQEEVAAGWLDGPISPGDVHPSEPISRRFGIRQGSKIRPIDDFSASGVNAAAAACEAPMLHTVDVLAALLSEWFQKSSQSGVDSTVVTRTYDLKSAYRQIGLSPQGRKKACISVYDPHTKLPRLLRLRVLPFGAVRSVHSFLRLSRALWYVGALGLHLLWTNFYDDFVVTSPPSLAASTSLAVEALFKLTGWAFAEDGKKCMPFSSSCQALGVLIDLSDSCKGRAFISNTCSRVDELSAALDGVINDGSITQVEARRLKGRMQFAEAQLFGRVGKRCIRTLTDASEGRGKRLDDSDILFLELFSDFLKTGPPREISSSTSESLHIFTDACYEKDSTTWGCGIGGVAISSCGVWQHFSLPLNANLREVLGEGQKKQIIFEAETLAAVVALAVWKDQIKFKRCVLYVDNEGTKFSLIKGYADNPTVDKLAQVFAAVESEAHTYLWISRVASFSNVADEPSRGDSSRMLKFASNCVNGLASSVMDVVVSKAFEVEMGREAQASDVLRISHLKRKKCVHPWAVLETDKRIVVQTIDYLVNKMNWHVWWQFKQTWSLAHRVGVVGPLRFSWCKTPTIHPYSHLSCVAWFMHSYLSSSCFRRSFGLALSLREAQASDVLRISHLKRKKCVHPWAVLETDKYTIYKRMTSRKYLLISPTYWLYGMVFFSPLDLTLQVKTLLGWVLTSILWAHGVATTPARV